MLELKSHVKGVRCSVDQHYEYLTHWRFEITHELALIVHRALVREAKEIWDKFTASGLGHIPAMADYGEDWIWIYFGKDEIPVTVDGDAIIISLANQPESKEDRLDPAHEDWFKPSATQWVQAASAFSDLVRVCELS